MIKYILAFLFLLSASVHSAKGDKCSEPEWLNICGQVQSHCAKNVEIKIYVTNLKNDWTRFYVHCTNKELDPVYGYAKCVNGQWKMLIFGSAITPEDFKKLGIPDWIQ